MLGVLWMKRSSFARTTRNSHLSGPMGVMITAYRDDEDEVDAHGEVRQGEHVEGSQLDELQRLDEALQVTPSPAGSDHRILRDEGEPHHKPAVHSTYIQHSRPHHRGRRHVKGREGGWNRCERAGA